MTDLGVWMSISALEEDQVVPHSREPKNSHFSEVLMPLSPLTTNEEP